MPAPLIDDESGMHLTDVPAGAVTPDLLLRARASLQAHLAALAGDTAQTALSRAEAALELRALDLQLAEASKN